MRSCRKFVSALAVATLSAVAATPAHSGYDKPPQNVLDVLHAPSPPRPYVSPKGDKILLSRRWRSRS
jgi:hypothetical protein